MYLILSNGKRLSGESWKDLLNSLQDNTNFNQSMSEYMLGVTERAEILYRERIKYHDEESFLKELERLGIIKIGGV